MKHYRRIFTNRIKHYRLLALCCNFTDDINCPIAEDTVLFVDKKPEYDGEKPMYDYIVKRVAKSLNSISIAISKVNVS